MNNEIQEIPRPKAYKVNLSKGESLPCDEDELANIILAIKSGSPCKIRSGIFNPSYYVSITVDTDRISEINRINGDIYNQNQIDYSLTGGKNLIEYKGLEKIKDIFESVNLQALPKSEPSVHYMTRGEQSLLDKKY